MVRTISQRELRNNSGEIMRGLDRGESYVVTRNGTPVGELIPFRRQQFVPWERLVAAFASAPKVDYQRLRADLDAVVDQSIEPRV